MLVALGRGRQASLGLIMSERGIRHWLVEGLGRRLRLAWGWRRSLGLAAAQVGAQGGRFAFAAGRQVCLSACREGWGVASHQKPVISSRSSAAGHQQPGSTRSTASRRYGSGAKRLANRSHLLLAHAPSPRKA